MFLLSFSRVIKFGLQDIGRNIWLSIVTITILILALFSINLLLTVNVISSAAIDSIKDKVDVNVYLKADSPEDKIMALKARVGGLEQVRDVNYISKTQALEEFRIKHKNNPEVLEALLELGTNPLSPVLVIKANNVEQYESLILNLNKIEDDIIESRNFDDHKMILGKINNISQKVNKVGLFVSLIFIITTILVVFNSVRVAIYTHRKEIAIMKLVGASNWFVKAPFLISGAIYSFIGTIVIIAIFYPFLTLLQPYLEAFFVGYDINIISYFNSHFLAIFGLEFLGTAFINMIASFTALGRYSRV